MYSIKYLWQQSVVDAFLEFKPEPLRDKISTAERAISQRLCERPADLEEQLALRDALFALDILTPKKAHASEETAEKIASLA
jgi:hypothetical protein